MRKFLLLMMIFVLTLTIVACDSGDDTASRYLGGVFGQRQLRFACGIFEGNGNGMMAEVFGCGGKSEKLFFTATERMN